MNRKENPSHIRINRDPEICEALVLAKKSIQIKSKRKNVSDREALHHLIFSNNGSYHFNEVLNRELAGLQQTCCIHEPKIRDFPFVQLRMLILHFIDGHVSKPEIMDVLRGINARGGLVEDKIAQQIKERKKDD